MSVFPERLPSSAIGDTPLAVASALLLAVCGWIAGFGGVAAFQLSGSLLGVAETDAFAVLGSGVQIGFGVVAVAYLWRVEDRHRFVRVRIPTIRDLGWIAALPLGLWATSVLLGVVLPAIGLSVPTHETSRTVALLFDRPALWIVALLGLYAVAAPAEELLFRGVVQGRVRPHLGTAGVVLVSATAFALMHGVFAVFSTGSAVYSVVSTGAGGLLWGYAYERTENLAVTALNHAMMWTIPFESVFSIF